MAAGYQVHLGLLPAGYVYPWEEFPQFSPTFASDGHHLDTEFWYSRVSNNRGFSSGHGSDFFLPQAEQLSRPEQSRRNSPENWNG
jgi:hypothetical protein